MKMHNRFLPVRCQLALFFLTVILLIRVQHIQAQPATARSYYTTGILNSLAFYSHGCSLPNNGFALCFEGSSNEISSFNSDGSIRWIKSDSIITPESVVKLLNIRSNTDGSIAVIGFGYTSNGNHSTCPLMIYVCDSSGQSLWKKTFRLTFDNSVPEYGTIQWTHDNGLLATLSSSIQASAQTSHIHGGSQIIRTNVQGDTLWTRYLNSTNTLSSKIYSTTETYDHGFVLTGLMNDIAYPGIDIGFALKLDSTGQTDWCKYFLGTTSFYPNSVIVAPGGNLLFTGTKDGVENGIVVETDQNCTLIASHSIDNFEVYSCIPVAFQTDGIIYSLIHSETSSLVKISNTGSVLWNSTVYNAGFSCDIPMANGVAYVRKWDMNQDPDLPYPYFVSSILFNGTVNGCVPTSDSFTYSTYPITIANGQSTLVHENTFCQTVAAPRQSGQATIIACQSSSCTSFNSIWGSGLGNICSNQTEVLSNTLLGPGITYQWFKDGYILPNATSSSINASPGNYYCLANDNGCMTFSQQFTIYNSDPMVSFTIQADTAIAHHYYVYNNSQPSSSNGILSYSWDWGDGSPNDTTAYPTHIYAASGFYSICLTITDLTNGCSNSFCYPNTYFSRSNNSIVQLDVVPGTLTALQNDNLPNFSVYPNPSDGNFTVSFQDVALRHLALIDLTGRTVWTIDSKEQSFNIHPGNQLKNGLYRLVIRDQNGYILSKSVLIQR